MNFELEKRLASIIVNHSLEVKENTRVLIQYQSNKCHNLVKEIVKEVIRKKGTVALDYQDQDITEHIHNNINDGIITDQANKLKYNIENYDGFVRLYYNESDYYDKFMDPDKRNKLQEELKPYKEVQINERKWVLLNYPSYIDAFKAKMTPEEFYNFSMKVMTVDYDKMNKDMKILKDLMDKTKKVRIVAPNTDITFSIEGMPSIICSGECNIPDGECYTAPVKDSINGTITYNVESPYHGEIFRDISLTFENGKIVKFNSSNNQLMEEIFNTDEGARYVGEFSLGLNPKIMNPMGDILFDEKIAGSLHFTPGCCYDNCPNGNKSNIHWDLVLIQREECGGGEIYFDDKLIRKDGLFVLDELKELNYK